MYIMNRQELKRKESKIEVLRHYGNNKLACVKCGFDDIRALSIDHINGDGNKHRKEIGAGGHQMYRWLIRNNYPEGYQTLCMNCQWIKRESVDRISSEDKIVPKFKRNVLV